MGNPDKRKRRSKEKAKLAGVDKHEKISSKKNPKIVQISSEMVELFKTLPSFSSTYEAVPYIRQFRKDKNSIQHPDNPEDVATLYAMYGHWTTTGSDTIYTSELLLAGQLIFENPLFKEKFYSEFPLRED